MRAGPWSAEDEAMLSAHFPVSPTQKVAAMLGRSITSTNQRAYKLGMKKTAEYLASPDACRLRRGDNVGAATRFKKGQTPVNRGLRRPGWAPGRMKETQFKPGDRTGIAQRNWRPIGTVRKDPEGYLRIKVREGQKGKAYGFGNTKIWPLLNRHVWEQHHGPIPAGHAVVFKDGNPSNCELDNLEMVSRRDLMLRNSSQRWGPEVFEVIQLRGALNRKIRRLNEKQDTGSAQPPL